MHNLDETEIMNTHILIVNPYLFHFANRFYPWHFNFPFQLVDYFPRLFSSFDAESKILCNYWIYNRFEETENISTDLVVNFVKNGNSKLGTWIFIDRPRYCSRLFPVCIVKPFPDFLSLSLFFLFHSKIFLSNK